MRINLVVFFMLSLSVSAFAQHTSRTDSLLQKYLANEDDLALLYKLCESYYYYDDDFEEADKYIRIGIEKSKSDTLYNLKFKHFEAKVLALKGEYDEVLDELNTVLPVCKDKGFKDIEAAVYRDIANAYWRMGQLKKGVFYNLKSIRQFENLKDTFGYITVSVNLAAVYTDMKEYKAADSIYNEALTFFLQRKSIADVAKIYGYKGALKFYINDFKAARNYYNKALKIYEQQNLALDIAIMYGNIAETYEKTNDYQKALDFYLKAFSTEKIHNYIPGMIFLSYGIAGTYAKLKDWDNAFKYYDEALKLAESANEQREKPVIYNLMSETYEAKGDYKNALLYHKKYMQIKDTIFNEQTAQHIQEIRAKYEIEKAQQRNLILERINSLNADKIQRMKYRQYVLGTFTLIFLSLMTILLVLRKKNIKKKDIIIEQNTIINKKNQELENYQKELERKFEQRTAELEIALEKSRESDRLKSAFLNNISHEIRTPMNAISGFSELLEKSAEPRQQKYLQYIQTNVNDLAELITGIIELSSLQDTGTKALIAEISSEQFCDMMINYAKKQLVKNGKSELELNFKQDTVDFKFKTDFEKLTGLFKQLINNAVKYTAKGSITLNCFVEKTSVIFVLKDTGIGIPQEKIELIFKPFYRIENKNQLYRGVGIGLALVREYVKILDADLKIDSTVGQGTSVYVKLHDAVLF